MPISAYARDFVMDLLLSQSWISIHSADPGLIGENEIPVLRLSGAALFNPVIAGTKSTKELLFRNCPETSVTYLGVWDAETGGNFIWAAKAKKQRDMDEGDSLQVDAGEFSLTLR